MKNIAKITRLYDFYGKLLTKKQQKYIEYYYFNDLSLGEIANEEKISRNAIYSTINEGLKDLNYYEKELKLIEKQDLVMNLYKKIENKKLREELISIETNFNKR